MIETLEQIQGFLTAENQRDWQTWARYLHPEVQYYLMGDLQAVNGRENFAQYMQQVYSHMPDWQFQAVNSLGAEQIVMVEFEGRGHFTGTYQGEQYQNVPLQLRSLVIYEFNEGLIARVREYSDRLGMERQLAQAGHEPPPAPETGQQAQQRPAPNRQQQRPQQPQQPQRPQQPQQQPAANPPPPAPERGQAPPQNQPANPPPPAPESDQAPPPHNAPQAPQQNPPPNPPPPAPRSPQSGEQE